MARNALLLASLGAILAAPPVRVAPGASIASALSAARAAGATEVLLAPGVHYLSEPLELTAAHSGLTLRGEGPGATTIDGGVPLAFTARAPGLWAAPLPAALRNSTAGLSALYVGGERRLRAREPSAVGAPPWSYAALLGDAATFHMAGPLQPCSLPAFGQCPEVDHTGFLADMRAPRAPNASWQLQGALICVAQAWTWDWGTVQGLEAGGRVTHSRLTDAVGAFGTAAASPSGGRWFLENFREALDAPGEFFVDAAAGEVLYMPLPGEALPLQATMPALVSLWRVAGTAQQPAVGITLQDLTLRGWGEGMPRVPVDSYVAAVSVGPHASGITLRNLTLTAGVANAVGVCSSVANLTMDRLQVHEVGGAAVKGVCQDTASSSNVVLSNSTISRTGLVFVSGAAAYALGSSAQVLHNEIFNVPLDGVTFQQPGGPSLAAAPQAEVAFNSIHDYGQGVASDFGGVYISSGSDLAPATNWLAAHVHHNLVQRASCYAGGYGANGLYSDHGTSGTRFTDNVLAHLGSYGMSFHCGLNLSSSNNLLYNVSASWGDAAVSGCTAQDAPKSLGLTAAVHTTVFALGGTSNPYALKARWDTPPRSTLAAEDNVYFAGVGRACTFPGGVPLAQWQAASGNDQRSLQADPLVADAEGGDWSLLPGSPAWALGWHDIDLSSVGVLPEH